MRRLVRSIALPVACLGALAAYTPALAASQAPAVTSHLGRALSPRAVRGTPTHVVRKAVVLVDRLPPPVSPTGEAPEPKETEPVTGAPRSVGVIPIVPAKTLARRRPASRLRLSSRILVTASLTGLGAGDPPDTQIAASSGYVVEFVNSSALVLDHHGVKQAAFTLNSLFGSSTGCCDSKIVYNAQSGFFFGSYLGKASPHGGPSEVDLAVSRDPAKEWYVYKINAESTLQDQPKLGVSSGKVTMAWNQHGGTRVIVIQKAGLIAGRRNVAAVIWAPDSTRWGVIPAVQLSASATAYAVYHRNNTSTMGLLSYTGVPGISTTSYTETVLSVAPMSAPGPTDQPPPPSGSTALTLDTGDNRLQTAALLRGTLWVAAGDPCRYQSDTASRACLRVVEISTDTKSVEQDVDLTMVGGDVMYPAVTIDHADDLWIAFSASSTSEEASSAVAEVPGGTIGTTVGGYVYQPGTGIVTCGTATTRRCGDYSGIALGGLNSTPMDGAGHCSCHVRVTRRARRPG